MNLFSNPCLILALQIITGVVSSSVRITDRLYWCDDIDPTTTPILQIENSCVKSKANQEIIVHEGLNKTLILSKNAYEVFGKGYQCTKQQVNVITYKNIFFQTSKTTTFTNIKLSKEECIVMMTSNKCGEKKMSCEEDICSFEDIPEATYAYMTTRTIVGSRCKVRTRVIKALKATSMLFKTKDCTATKGFCHMKQMESIIVWDKDIISKCPFTIIKSVNLEQNEEEPKIFYDKKDKLAFKIVETTKECEISMVKTTENLYLVFYSDDKMVEHLYEKCTTNKTYQTDVRSRHELMLSEADGASYDLTQRIQKNQIQNCRNMALFLNYLKQNPKKYDVAIDSHGVERIFYSDHGLIFMPTCVLINTFDIHVENTRNEYCIEEFEISFVMKNITMHAFINSNRIIVSKPTQTDNCDKIINFPYSKQMVIASKTSNQVVETHNMIKLDDLFTEREINFPHLRQLMDPIDMVNEINSMDGLIDNMWRKNKNRQPKFYMQSEVSDIGNIVEKAKSINSKFRGKVNDIYDKASDFADSVVDETSKFYKLLMITIAILIVCAFIVFVLYSAVQIKKICQTKKPMNATTDEHLVSNRIYMEALLNANKNNRN